MSIILMVVDDLENFIVKLQSKQDSDTIKNYLETIRNKSDTPATIYSGVNRDCLLTWTNKQQVLTALELFSIEYKISIHDEYLARLIGEEYGLSR
mgnify:CR=1 FL=1|tara:strand:- start:2696 stop:2980 length:285 start_codon:yes stop_codon:yes gene_type:complete